MKHLYTKLVSLSLGLMLLASCSDDFLETSPTNAVASSMAFGTINNARTALNGIHRLLYSQGSNQDQAGEQSQMLGRDLLGEDLAMSSAGNGWYNSLYKWIDHRNKQSSNNRYPWAMYYNVIGNANNIIDGMKTNLASQANDPAYKEVMAQALTYRAWAHFNLVQYYAKRYDETAKGKNTQLGVVLNISSKIEAKPRATVEEVYAQINADLNSAIELFKTTTVAPAQISDLSLSAAYAIKARVALTTGDWKAAIDNAAAAIAGHALFTADNISANGGYPTVYSSYPGSGSEWIWGFQQASDQPTYFYSYFAYMSWNFNSSNIRSNPKSISRELYNAMSATDARKTNFSLTGTDIYPLVTSTAKVCSYMTRKFRAFSTSDSRGDLAYIRVAEMYLIKAEAEARSGLDGDAQNTLFQLVSTRDNKYVKSASAGSDLLAEILLQRRIELWGEGFRFFDLKRLNAPLTRISSEVTDPAAPVNSTTHIVSKYSGHHNPTLCGVTDVPAGDDRWQYFIPQDEVNSNSLIEQNK